MGPCGSRYALSTARSHGIFDLILVTDNLDYDPQH